MTDARFFDSGEALDGIAPALAVAREAKSAFHLVAAVRSPRDGVGVASLAPSCRRLSAMLVGMYSS